MPKCCVIEGDGIGHEVIPAALAVLQRVIPDLEAVSAEAGWDCFQKHGVSVPEETLAAIRDCKAALFGAVSSPSYKVAGYRSAIITMRQALDLYSNLRPVQSMPRLSPRPDIDLLVVRENTEGMYAGRERLEGETAIAERVISRAASRRIGLRALQLARSNGRKGRLTIVHKANVLPLTDGLFRSSVYEVIKENGADQDVQVNELLVDNAAYQMISAPENFDVIVTTNLFGDILSDEAAYWCGGMGMAPSLNWGEDAAIAEPVHGSAPDIAGKGIANPLAAMLSAALLARYAWGQEKPARRIETAVKTALDQDIQVEGNHIAKGITTTSITQAVLAHLN
ncbi:MAG: isocitrate/isopropylmalate dehydrogenase family protein [Anaerolineaceae bacterium]|nr:isocitrate/isopropylmalate dehydrogenase family protein [Anaerolineaceae bacterium]